MKCLNCSTPLQGHYCYNCGLKVTDRKFTIRSMVTDLFFSAFHVEKKGLPHTIKLLALTPGVAIREYLDGKRLSLYPPFKYLILMGALVILFSLRYRFFHNEYTKANTHDSNGILDFLSLSAEEATNIESFFQFAEDKATLLNIAAIPVFAFFSWAFLSKKKFNFAENLILSTFITAQQLFFLLLLCPLLEIVPSSHSYVMGFYTVAIMIYNVWVYLQFFPGKKIYLTIGSALIVLVSYVYQFPVNFLVYLIYEKYFHHSVNWGMHMHNIM
jgi:hypothetical protein